MIGTEQPSLDPKMQQNLQRWLIRPPWHLEFPKALEEFFEAETSHSRRMWLARCGFFGLLVFNFFWVTDAAMIPDITHNAILARLGFVTPISLLVLGMFFFPMRPWVRECLQICLPLVTNAGILWMLSTSTHPNAGYCVAGVVYVLMYAFNVARLRYAYSMPLAALSFLMFLAFLPRMQTLPESTHQFFISLYVAGLVLGLFANRAQEISERTGFLLNLSERLRQENLSRDNVALSLLARTDPLTGLANRRHFDTSLAHALQHDQPCALLMFDVDHFKAYNDAFGHQVGDTCLRTIASEMQQKLRDQDLVARLGGEEFALLLPKTDRDRAVLIASRILQAVESRGMPHAPAAQRTMVTISAGIALTTQGESSESLIARADAALYRAKAEGRNCWRLEGEKAPQ